MKPIKKFGFGALIFTVGMSAQLVNAYQPQPYGPMYHGGYYKQAPMPRPYEPRRPMYGAQRHPGAPVAQANTYQAGVQNTQQSSVTKQSEQNASNAATVSIGQMRFEPAIVTVKKGAKVTWQQKDAMPHTVTANDKSFASQRLGANDEFAQTFSEPGIYTYYCSIHPSMQGVVRVIE